MRPPAPRLFAAALISIALAACTDRSPVGTPAGPEPAPPSALVAMTCTVSVGSGTMACGPQGAGPGVSAAILGNQGESVRLRSTGMSYDGADTFRMAVTVENLTGQALGTADGTTPSADGVRVFLHSGPVATGGEGPVEVANADGEGFFLSAGQKYFQYDGVLTPGDTSAAREWRFTLPNTVTSFGFSVYVAAPVRAEAGWVSVTPLAPWIQVGDTMHMEAIVRNAAARTLDGAAVAWSSSNPAVATVDSLGVLTAVGPGSATVTGTSGGRTGSVAVRVSAQGAAPHASIHRLDVLGASVTADDVDSVAFEVGVRTTPWEVYHVGLQVRHADGERRRCDIHSPGRPTTWGAVYRCTLRFPTGSPVGVWRVDSLTVTMRNENTYSASQLVTHFRLNAAGAPAHVYVEAKPEDRTPPTLLDFSFSPDSVEAGKDLLKLDVRASDAGAGLTRAGIVFSSGGAGQMSCVTTVLHSGTGADGVYRCSVVIPRYLDGGTWLVDMVWVEDGNANRDTVPTAELQASGYPTQLLVTGTVPDTVAPAITAFSFSPDSVAGNGTDSVDVTLTAEEPADGAGVGPVDMEFEMVADSAQRRRCVQQGIGRLATRTMQCRLAFAAEDAGEWRVRYIRAYDYAGNVRLLYTADVQAAGYPTRLIVTAP
jgi:hypothetical protein